MNEKLLLLLKYLNYNEFYIGALYGHYYAYHKGRRFLCSLNIPDLNEEDIVVINDPKNNSYLRGVSKEEYAIGFIKKYILC